MEILSEQINDIPIIIGMCEKISIEKIIEKNVRTHKNQEGLSNGEIVTAWIAYILSTEDHRKSHVSEWSEKQKKNLEGLFEKEIKGKEFSDDRLTGILSKLSRDEVWEGIEKELWGGTVEILELNIKKEKKEEGREIWLDGTSASGHHKINEEGLMRYGGYSKDNRPDLPQLKMMISVDKELKMPIATDVVAGNSSEDILYLPNIKRVREIIGKEEGKRTLYSGDSKMSSKSIRADIAKNNEYYICPLPLLTKSRRKMLDDSIEKARKGEVKLEKIYTEKAGQKEEIGYGYEYERKEKVEIDKEKIIWSERLQVIKSLAYAEGEKEKLDNKIAKAKEEIASLKSKQFRVSEEEEAMRYIKEKVEKTIEKHSLTGVIKVCYKVDVEQKEHKRTEKRNGKERKGKYTTIKIRVLPEKVETDQEKLQILYDRLGWRMYVTNAPKDRLSLQESYNHYRGSQYIVENSFHVLKGKPIGIRPIFVWKDEQIKGLMRLLTLCLKISSIISSKLRFSLQSSGCSLQEIYAGQPKKKTSSPTTKTVLELFYRQRITLIVVVTEKDILWDISQISKTCCEILNHLGLVDIFERIIAVLYKRNLSNMNFSKHLRNC